MQNLQTNLHGKVVHAFKAEPFRDTTIQDIILADESGHIRATIWGD